MELLSGPSTPKRASLPPGGAQKRQRKSSSKGPSRPSDAKITDGIIGGGILGRRIPTRRIQQRSGRRASEFAVTDELYAVVRDCLPDFGIRQEAQLLVTVLAREAFFSWLSVSRMNHHFSASCRQARQDIQEPVKV